MTYSTEAIMLRRVDANEYDRLYTAYTKEHGKLRLLGRGTRRPKAKLAASLEPYSKGELTIVRGRSIDCIVFAQLHESGARLTTSWEHVRTAAYLAECVDLLTKEQRDDGVFELLTEALYCIGHAPALIVPFTLRLLSLLGYAAALDRCVECRRMVTREVVHAVPERGGIACHRCAGRMVTNVVLEEHDRMHLIHLGQMFVPGNVSPTVEWFAFRQLEAHLPIPMRTMLTTADSLH